MLVILRRLGACDQDSIQIAFHRDNGCRSLGEAVDQVQKTLKELGQPPSVFAMFQGAALGNRCQILTAVEDGQVLIGGAVSADSR